MKNKIALTVTGIVLLLLIILFNDFNKMNNRAQAYSNVTSQAKKIYKLSGMLEQVTKQEELLLLLEKRSKNNNILTESENMKLKSLIGKVEKLLDKKPEYEILLFTLRSTYAESVNNYNTLPEPLFLKFGDAPDRIGTAQ